MVSPSRHPQQSIAHMKPSRPISRGSREPADCLRLRDPVCQGSSRRVQSRRYHSICRHTPTHVHFGQYHEHFGRRKTVGGKVSNKCRPFLGVCRGNKPARIKRVRTQRINRSLGWSCKCQFLDTRSHPEGYVRGFGDDLDNWSGRLQSVVQHSATAV